MRIYYYLLLFISLFGLPLIGWSQEITLQNPGNYWNHYGWPGVEFTSDSSDIRTVKNRISRDSTMIDRKWYRNVEYTKDTLGIDGRMSSVVYLRFDSLRVFARTVEVLYAEENDWVEREWLIYDFGMEVGDSIVTPLPLDRAPPENFSSYAIVIDIDTVELLNGELRKR